MTTPNATELVVTSSLARRITPVLSAAAVAATCGLATITGLLTPWPTYLALSAVGIAIKVALVREPIVTLRLDGYGVTVPGHPVIPWTNLLELRVGPMADGHLRTKRLQRGRLGFELLVDVHPLSSIPSMNEEGSQQPLRPTSMIFDPTGMTASVAQIAEAAYRLGNTPTVRVSNLNHLTKQNRG